MLTESLLVASVGAAAGIGLAYLSIDWLSTTVRNLDNPPPSWITFDVDALVLTFTVGATLTAAVLGVSAPAGSYEAAPSQLLTALAQLSSRVEQCRKLLSEPN